MIARRTRGPSPDPSQARSGFLTLPSPSLLCVRQDNSSLPNPSSPTMPLYPRTLRTLMSSLPTPLLAAASSLLPGPSLPSGTSWSLFLATSFLLSFVTLISAAYNLRIVSTRFSPSAHGRPRNNEATSRPRKRGPAARATDEDAGRGLGVPAGDGANVPVGCLDDDVGLVERGAIWVLVVEYRGNSRWDPGQERVEEV
jgi:hypothetical protein